jgi:hypothetical protein
MFCLPSASQCAVQFRRPPSSAPVSVVVKMVHLSASRWPSTTPFVREPRRCCQYRVSMTEFHALLTNTQAYTTLANVLVRRAAFIAPDSAVSITLINCIWACQPCALLLSQHMQEVGLCAFVRNPLSVILSHSMLFVRVCFHYVQWHFAA